MRQTRAIASRLCTFINQFSKVKNISAEKAAQDYFDISSQCFHEIQNGRIAPTLQTCELAVKLGCHPKYLFLGDTNIPGDAVRCFSYKNGNGCRVFDYQQCQGYDKCPWYKSERAFLATADRKKPKAKA